MFSKILMAQFALSLSCGLASVSFAQSDSKTSEQILKGRVKKVIDGDSLIIIDSESEEHETQLDGIDAPEIKQDYGKESFKELEKLVEGKEVTVKWKSKDNFDRILGKVYLEDKFVNLKMLELGAAWHYKRYNKEEEFATAETQAKEKKIGLWKSDSPEAPWDFRKNNRSKD